MYFKDLILAAAEKRRAAAGVLRVQETLLKADTEYMRIAAIVFETITNNASLLNLAPPTDITDVMTSGESSPSTFVYKFFPIETLLNPQILAARLTALLAAWLGISKSEFVKKVKISIVSDRIILYFK